MSEEFFDRMFATTPVMAILRGLGRERTLELAHIAWDMGIASVEVPIQTDHDVNTLEAVVQAGQKRGFPVGAGTVVSAVHVAQAKECGAAFTVSPGIDREVIAACRAVGLAHLPGVATPSDIQLASTLGLRWVKAFPASVLGASWLHAMSGPFPQMKFVATGGLDAHNAPEFLNAGARVVAVGSALADSGQLQLLAQLLHTPVDTAIAKLEDSTNAD